MKNDLQILIDNLLDIWATVDPRRIITKVKLHVLAHLPDDIRRFGPAVIFATEIFECFNAVFRMCSVLSNHLAPSRDIAITLADMERFKHLVSGGYWKDDNGRYVRAGLRVQNFLKKNPELQRRLGWADETLLHAGDLFLHGSKDILLTRTGTVKRAPRKKRCPSTWISITQGVPIYGPLPPSADLFSPEITWDQCQFVISRSKHICRVGAWVFFRHLVRDLDCVL